MHVNCNSDFKYESSVVPAKEDSFNTLPDELMLKIFSFLNAVDLEKCGEVCREWRNLTSEPTLWKALDLDLRKISPLLKIFDRSDWAKHIDLASFGLTFDDVNEFDFPTLKESIPLIRRRIALLSIEGNAGVTILEIPKGLTFNKLIEIDRLRKGRKSTNFFNFSNRIGNIQLDKTSQIIITNNIFEESRSLLVSAQNALLNKFGWEMPQLLEAATLLVITRLCNNNPYTYTNRSTYTSCSDRMSEETQISFGDFGSNSKLTIDEKNFDFCDPDRGTLGVWK